MLAMKSRPATRIVVGNNLMTTELWCVSWCESSWWVRITSTLMVKFVAIKAPHSLTHYFWWFTIATPFPFVNAFTTEWAPWRAVTQLDSLGSSWPRLVGRVVVNRLHLQCVELCWKGMVQQHSSDELEEELLSDVCWPVMHVLIHDVQAALRGCVTTEEWDNVDCTANECDSANCTTKHAAELCAWVNKHNSDKPKCCDTTIMPFNFLWACRTETELLLSCFSTLARVLAFCQTVHQCCCFVSN